MVKPPLHAKYPSEETFETAGWGRSRKESRVTQADEDQ